MFRGCMQAAGGIGEAIVRSIVVIVSALLCGACSQTFPIAVIGKDLPGGIMRGEGVASLAGGTFSVSGGRLRCSGDYDATDSSPTIRVPVTCSDGRRGIIVATRNGPGKGGGGRFTLNDGTSGEFIFGPGAERL